MEQKTWAHDRKRYKNSSAEKNHFVGIKGTKGRNIKFCEHCIMGRQKRVSFMRNNFKRDIEILNLVCSDVSAQLI